MGSLSPVKTVPRRGKRRLVIDFFYNDSSGRKRRYRRDATAQHSKAAASAEARRLQELAARTGSPVASSAMPTLAEFVETTYRPVFMPAYRPGTRDRYEELLKQHVLRLVGRKRLDDIDYAAMARFNAELREDGVQPRGAGNLVRSIVNAAVKARILPKMPDLPTYPQPKKLPRAPTFEVVLPLLEVAQGWVRTAIALTAYAGLRQGEVRAVLVEHLDFDRQLIRVCQAFSASDIVEPKGDQERYVPMADALVPILRDAVAGKLPKAFVLTNRRGNVPRRQAVWTAVQKAADRAGVTRWSHHSLRHFFCSEVLDNGANVEAVRKLAGHARLGTTERYLHAKDADAATVAMFGGNNVVTRRKSRS